MRKTIKAEIERREARRLSEGAERLRQLGAAIAKPKGQGKRKKPGPASEPAKAPQAAPATAQPDRIHQWTNSIHKGARIRVQGANTWAVALITATTVPSHLIELLTGADEIAMIRYRRGEHQHTCSAAIRRGSEWLDLEGKPISLKTLE